MKENTVKIKSLDFAIRMVGLCEILSSKKKQFIISKQLLKSGTSVGANICEAEHAQSKADFIHKMAIAQKEINEALYWLEVLKGSETITEDEFENIYPKGLEILKLLTTILKTAKTQKTGD